MPHAINGDVRIRYEVEGEGEPLVMVHGFSSTLEMWREMGYVQALVDGYRLILIDPRGHGQSDKPHDPAKYQAELMAGDVVAVLDNLGIEKAHYLGASMGAAIGFHVAERSLDRCRSLMLLAYGRYGAPTELQLQFQAMGHKMEEMALSMGPEAALSAIEGMIGAMSPEDGGRFLTNDHRALLAFMQAFEEWPGFEGALPRMTVPSLVIAADGDPHYAAAEKCAELMPGATFVSLTGGVHSLASYNAEAVTPTVKSFLRKNVGHR